MSKLSHENSFGTNYPVLAPGEKDPDLIEIEELIAKARQIDEDFITKSIEKNKKDEEDLKESIKKRKELSFSIIIS